MRRTGFHRAAHLLLAAAALLGPLAAQADPGLLPGTTPVDADGKPTHCVFRVVDEATGAPLAGATAYAVDEHMTPLPGRFWFERKVVADGDGFVRLPIADIRDRYDWVYVAAEGYGTVSEFGLIDDEIVRLRRGIDVPIEVRDALDRPVAGAGVGLILGCGHTPDWMTVYTDASGRAVLPAIDPDEGELWPFHPALLSSYHSAHAWRPGNPPLVLRCGPTRLFRGVVHDEQGRPMPHVFVGAPSCHRGPWCQADATGAFELLGAEPEADLTVHQEERPYPFVGPIPHGDVVVRLDAETRGTTIPRTEVHVRVLEAGTRTPAPAATVRVTAPDCDFYDDAEVDEDGWSTLKIPVGERVLYVIGKHDQYVPRAVPVRVEEGEGTEIEVEVHRCPTVVLRVENLPEKGQVHLAYADREREITDLVAGGEPISLRPGQPAVFRLEDNYGGERMFPTPKPPVDEPVVLRWYAPTRVRVRLVDGAGQPVPGWATVDGHANWEALARDPGEPRSVWTLETFTEHRAWLALKPAGPGHRRRAVAIDLPALGDGGDPVDLGTVRLWDVDAPRLRAVAADGAPLSGASCELHRPGSILAGTLTADGGFDDYEPRAGDVVRIEYGEKGTATLPLVATLEGAGPWQLVAPAGRLAITAIDGGGALVEDFSVLIADRMYQAEDYGGAVRIRGIGAGRHRVFFAARGRRAHVAEVTLAEGEASTLRAVLLPR